MTRLAPASHAPPAHAASTVSYRDKAPYGITVCLEDLARGRSYEEVAPRGR